ncbi:Aldo/keto reductase [Gonapodya prolifera JEL478]|uniref:Aldo/keto reductase n=1 Tax=Gonapodya prolifera (strain JEL478) TaxID=1344416 RepID=A0A139ABQ1_GONPJ|nr:Aldo/keto reductase [Gonapodya prolifera JEL478]|eukprot:KXS13843.1 Aldo/keto reductase [Gonapodya prolifera JEL478]
MVHHSAFARSHAMPASRHNLAFVFRRHISLSFTNSLTSGNRRNRGPDRDVSTIKGRATAEGTRSYREKHRDLAGGWIPKKDWHVSRFGFGCHRISVSSSNPDKSENEAALRVALRGGVNIIDTGSWFENGNSERLVGDILKELTGSGELERQEVVVISKSGPIPPSLLSSLPSGIPYVEIPNSQVHWSAHPQFLEHYITYSLSRMGLDHIDIWGIDGFDRALASPQMSPTQLSDLLRSAFQHLDKEVERGRIGGYLWSSNSLSAPGGAAGFGWGLDKIVSLVERPENLLAIEYPFNLFESDVARAIQPQL